MNCHYKIPILWGFIIFFYFVIFTWILCNPLVPERFREAFTTTSAQFFDTYSPFFRGSGCAKNNRYSVLNWFFLVHKRSRTLLILPVQKPDPSIGVRFRMYRTEIGQIPDGRFRGIVFTRTSSDLRAVGLGAGPLHRPHRRFPGLMGHLHEAVAVHSPLRPERRSHKQGRYDRHDLFSQSLPFWSTAFLAIRGAKKERFAPLMAIGVQ